MTDSDRIFALSRIWSAARYSFVFWFRVHDVDWDGEYRAALERVSGEMSDIDFYLELSRFTALLRDGHTMVRFPRAILEKNALPVKLKYIGGEHIAVSAAKDLGIAPFSRIKAINGIETGEYFETRIFPYCWHAKISSAFASGQAYSLIPLVEKGDIALTTDAGEFIVPRVSGNVELPAEAPLRPSEPLSALCDERGIKISVTSDGICVIDIRDFRNAEMPGCFYSLLEKLKEMKGFIVDIRGNTGGHSEYADQFAQAFIAGEFPNERVRHRVHIGAYEAWAVDFDLKNRDLSDPWFKKITDVENGTLFEDETTAAHYDCPVTLTQPLIILEDAATWSSAENLLMDLDNAHRAEIIGEASYGSTGNPLVIDLPGGGYACICTCYCLYPDGRELINTGVRPHIERALTLEDVKNGNDGVMNFALEKMRAETEK